MLPAPICRAVVGKFYRPIKRPVTARIDAGVLAGLKRSGPGYQTRINALLRQAMAGGYALTLGCQTLRVLFYKGWATPLISVFRATISV